MTNNLNRSDQNLILATLMFSLVGVISCNIRAVAINLKSEVFDILFILDEENELDREEIGYALDTFEANINETQYNFTYQIKITSEQPIIIEKPYLFIFLQRPRDV